jgi:predicted AAA+ superfamily ATPase
MWIPRTFEPVLREPPSSLRLFPVWLLLGARQVGKSSLLLRCADSQRAVVNFLLRLVHPCHTNRTKRLTKSPKLYFLDAGLAAWLGGWRDPEALRLGPMAGALFETHVFGEILRRFRHRAHEAEITFWRTRDGEEIDFLVEAGGTVFPVEAKLGLPDGRELARLERIRETHWQQGAVVSLAAGDSPQAITSEWRAVSPRGLDFLPV